MTEPHLADIEAFLSRDLAVSLGNIRMALFWFDNAACDGPPRHTTGLRRLEGELARLETRATALAESLRSDAHDAVSQAEVDITPEPVAVEDPAPDTAAAIGEQARERMTEAPRQGTDDAPPAASDAFEAASPGALIPQSLQAQLPEPHTAASTPSGLRDPGRTKARAGLPPAGLVGVAFDETSPGSVGRDFPADELDPVAALPDSAEAHAGGESVAPEDAGGDDPLADRVIALRPRSAAAATTPSRGEPDLGASIDALLDAATAARTHAEGETSQLDLKTLERLLGEVRATLPAGTLAPGR